MSAIILQRVRYILATQITNHELTQWSPLCYQYKLMPIAETCPVCAALRKYIAELEAKLKKLK